MSQKEEQAEKQVGVWEISRMLKKKEWLRCIQPISLTDDVNLSASPLTKYVTMWWQITVFSLGLKDFWWSWVGSAPHNWTEGKLVVIMMPWQETMTWKGPLRSQSNSVHNTNSYIWPLLTELTTSWCWPFKWTALILRISSYSLEICLLTISHLLENNNTLPNGGLTDLFPFNLLCSKLTYLVVSPITRRP